MAGSKGPARPDLRPGKWGRLAAGEPGCQAQRRLRWVSFCSVTFSGLAARACPSAVCPVAHPSRRRNGSRGGIVGLKSFGPVTESPALLDQPH